MYRWFTSYFSVSKREFNGMFVFVFIMILIFIIPFIYDKLTYEPINLKIETLNNNLGQIETNNLKPSYNNYDTKTEGKHSAGILFNFNPNTLPLQGWLKLGLSEKQAKSILKYVSKGGKFYKKQDVKKMYAISPTNYQRFEPYIDIPEQNKFEPQKYQNNQTNIPIKNTGTKTVEKMVIEINNADSATLTTISGIGPAFASRILKYKNRIGGLINVEQLKEVYGIDSLKFQQIKNQISVNPALVNKIAINSAEFEQLKKLPYLSFKQMNAIIAFRKQHGNFTTINDLEKIVILNPTLIAKIAPYVQF
ncbi:MAG: hypothetical protein EAZ15_04745 [Sphingobacteriales bacterium]|nr:MAG: hypothetical protein EAZ15_04745 [Sphingobacteriales bacterium]